MLASPKFVVGAVAKVGENLGALVLPGGSGELNPEVVVAIRVLLLPTEGKKRYHQHASALASVLAGVLASPKLVAVAVAKVGENLGALVLPRASGVLKPVGVFAIESSCYRWRK